MKPHPVFHVGRFASVRHKGGKVPTATHTVHGVEGRRVAYWRRYKDGWFVIELGPEWWDEDA